jgi:hypothetical protein
LDDGLIGVQSEDQLKSREPAGKTTGLLANLGAGINRGIASTFGVPVDATTWALNKGIHGVNDVAGTNLPDISNPVGGSESIKRVMGYVGADPNNVAADGNLQRYAAAAGEGIGSMAVPGLGAEAALAKTGEALTPMARTALEAVRGGGSQPSSAMQTLRNLAGNALTGAGSGAGSQAAQDAAPENLKPVAGVAGSLIGGGGTAVFQHALSGFRAAPVEQQAADRFRAGLSNPDAVKSALATAPESTLPGSTYTPGQMTNDSGFLQMENWDRNQRPDVYRDRAAAQNKAQVDTLQGVQPGGDPTQIGRQVTDQLHRIDAAYGAVEDTARTHAMQVLDAIGGTEAPETYGAAGRQAVTGTYQPQMNALDMALADGQQRATAAMAQAPGQTFGDTDTATALQQHGQNLRQFVQHGRDARAAEENRLWSIVRQNGDLTFDHQPAVQAVDQAVSQMQPAGGDRLTPTEEQLYGAIKAWNGPQPLEVVKAARSNISDAANSAFRSGDAQAGRRLLTVRSGIDGSIENAVDTRAAQESAAVQQGDLDPGQTMGASLARDAQNFMAARKAGQRSPAGLANSGGNPGTNGAGGPPILPRVGPPESYTTAGRGNAGANPAVAQPPGQVEAQPAQPTPAQAAAGNYKKVSKATKGDTTQPIVPQDPSQVADQYATARAYTRDTHRIFDDTPAGAAIERGPYGGPEALPSSQVAAQFFNAGKHAPEDVANYMEATRNDPQARQALADYAAFSLRQAAGNPDGTLNLPKYRAWLSKHQQALTAIPEATMHFGSAADAQEAVQALTQQRQALTDRYQAAVGPTDATMMGKYWRPGPAGQDGVRSYVTETGGTPQAQEALINHAASTLRQAAVGPNGQIVPARYEGWVKKYAGALNEMPPKVRQRFATAADAQRELDTAAATRAEAVAGYQKSAAGFFLRSDDPVAAVGQAIRGNAGAQNMRFLASQVRNDPDAAAGLRRATLEWLMDKAAPQGIAGKEAGNTGASWVRNQTFRNALEDNRAALQHVFTPQQMQTLDRIAQDLQITDRSVSGSRPPIGPGTARDLMAAQRYGSAGQKASTLLSAIAGGSARIGSIVAGHMLGGVEGSMIGSAALDVTKGTFGAAGAAARAAREAEVTRLIQAAIEDPRAARLLLTKATPANMPTLAANLQRRLVQTAAGYRPGQQN